MSNCISISRNTKIVRLGDDLLHLGRLTRAITSAKKPEVLYREMTDAEATDYYLWWFLTPQNTQLRRDSQGHFLQVAFGDGRSTHTWRDFRGLINFVFPRFLTRPDIRANHVFQIMDTDSGQNSWVPIKIIFGSNKNLLNV